MSSTRRSFLTRGFFGGALLALAGGTGLALRRTLAREGLHTATFTAREATVLAAIAECVVPAADPRAVAERVDRAVSFLALESQDDFKRLLLLFENALAGFLFDGRTAPFTQLSLADRAEVLARWRDSRLAVRRSGYQALRKSCLGAHYGDPATWAAIGYAGPRRVAGLSYDDSKIGAKR
jgi:hypothetical protein